MPPPRPDFNPRGFALWAKIGIAAAIRNCRSLRHGVLVEELASMLKATLAVSALYLAAVGLGLLVFPLQFGVGAVPADASPELIALLRLLGGPLLGIAAMNWTARNAAPSGTMNAILVGNIVGFCTVALNDVWGVASGEARELAKAFLVVHLLFAIAFVAAARAGWRAPG
jgi:hypothetical protein